MREGRKLMKCWRSLVAVSLLAAAVFAGQGLSTAAGAGAKGKKKSAASLKKSGAKAKAANAAPKTIKVDLDKAIKVEVEPEEDLKPMAFKTSDGKSGWVVRIPGERPIATPAYANGMLFVGGGYGSNEFYAFDARTGKLRWQIDAGDDGPSAAVVEDGLVAFNTESCTLVVVEAKTGKLVWEEWLGDPLMSQPAISKGRVYMAFPGEGPGEDEEEEGDGDDEEETTPQSRRIAKAKLRHKKAKPTIKPTEEGSHTLLCADLRTGRHIWEQRISGDVISAPVVSGNKVYFTTFDGTSYALNADNGRVVWKKENAGTSAPVVVGSNVVVTQKEQSGAKAYEGLKVLSAQAGTDKDKRLLAREEATYLGADKGGGVALKPEAQAELDSSVGFGTAPAEAQLEKANEHLGVKTVVGGWAYQGSRAVYSRGRMINAQGRYLNSVNASDGNFAWRAEVSGEGVAEDEQVFSPPALGSRFMYLSSAVGHLLSVNQQDGRVGFMYLFDEPMVFQPALAEGNVYVGTSSGLLICLKTGNPDADGWYAWGGNAQHNKNQ